MKEKYGILRREWADSKPVDFNKVTRTAYLDWKKDTRTDEDGNTVEGWSGFKVELDAHTDDYGHVKSQLVEAAYSPKDEFGFVMNAVAYLIKKSRGEDVSDIESDADEFLAFNEYRTICADVAKKVMDSYK